MQINFYTPHFSLLFPLPLTPPHFSSLLPLPKFSPLLAQPNKFCLQSRLFFTLIFSLHLFLYILSLWIFNLSIFYLLLYILKLYLSDSLDCYIVLPCPMGVLYLFKIHIYEYANIISKVYISSLSALLDHGTIQCNYMDHFSDLLSYFNCHLLVREKNKHQTENYKRLGNDKSDLYCGLLVQI